MRQILFSLILISSFPVSAAAELVPAEVGAYEFSIECSNVEEERYGGNVIILKNETGASLENYRIHAMFVIDRDQPVMPGNVTERILRFLAIADEVILPLAHFGMTLTIYQGEFDDETPDQDIISSGNAVPILLFDGEEVAENVCTIRLTVGP